MSNYRVISFRQQVIEADPDFVRGSLRPWCYEFSNGRRFVDKPDPYSPLQDSGLANNGGVLMLTDATGYPIKAAGLSPGAVWDNGGEVNVISGASARNGIPGFFFGNLTAYQLLWFGGADLPTTQPTPGSLQLWNNGGVVCVA